MIKKIYHIAAFIVLALFLSRDSYCENKDPAPGKNYMSFAEIELPASLSQDYARYLGIKHGRKTRFSEIKSEGIILEVFNVYCHNCQKNVANMNKLYRLIENAGLSSKIKMLGVGISNSETEVSVFRKKFNVAFPVFAGPDNSLYDRILGKIEFPYINILKRDSGGNLEKAFAIERDLPEPEKMFKVVSEGLGMTQEPR
ncbi:MAG: hypothetical protein Q8O12_03235 [Candidatus Omnitrophota bacterium]|nr:hypothetical protein [Candidatus Omnitrophota bacterium]